MIPGIALRAIDPLARILSPEIYVRLHLPDLRPDPIIAAQAKQLANRLSAQEKQGVLARAKVLGADDHTFRKR
jgi:hypothetical protein